MERRKMMKVVELRKKSPAELQSLLKEKRLELDELREAVIRKKYKNVRELRSVRKDIARILTLLRAG